MATAIRLTAFATPIVAAIVWSAVFSRMVRPPLGLTARGAWWAVVLVTSTAVLLITERVARQLLPLAALLKLSLVFPDHVPSRFSVALRTGTTRQLARQLQQAKVEPTTRATTVTAPATTRTSTSASRTSTRRRRCGESASSTGPG